MPRLSKKIRLVPGAILVLVTLLTSFYATTFFQIYKREDVRVAASRWLQNHLSANTYILSDTGNVVDIPLPLKDSENKDFHFVSFDFYHLDQEVELQPQLARHLDRADYIFVPSRRIWANYLKFPERFPKTNQYYNSLFSGELGFEKLAEFRSQPGLLGVKIDDEFAEESFTVFDHPVIRIYRRKNLPY